METAAFDQGTWYADNSRFARLIEIQATRVIAGFQAQRHDCRLIEKLSRGVEFRLRVSRRRVGASLVMAFQRVEQFLAAGAGVRVLVDRQVGLTDERETAAA